MSNENTSVLATKTEGNLTPTIVKSKLEVALTKISTGISKLTEAESKLVYNEDHLQDVADFIAGLKKAKKAVEDQRVVMKEPALQEGRIIDSGAKLVNNELKTILTRASTKYDAMCRAIEKRKAEAKAESDRIAGIKTTIDNTVLDFSTKIASASNIDTLLDVERRMNLETANEKRYSEFLPDLKARVEAIRPLLALQKQNVRQLSELDKQAETAPDDTLMEILEKKEQLEAGLTELGTRIQETAINQTSSSQPEQAKEEFPEVAVKRRTWKYEITDIQKLQKAHPEFVEMIVKDDEVKALLKAKIEAGETKGKEELIYSGIKFFVDKKYS